MLFLDTFTFIRQPHDTAFWLDHCITTTVGESLIANASVLNDIACSVHLPLCTNVNCNFNPLLCMVIIFLTKQLPMTDTMQLILIDTIIINA